MSSEIKGYSLKGLWHSAVPYVVPPVAAAAAIVPVYYGFAAKTAQQLGNPIPKIGVAQALKNGAGAAPTIGVIVGTQLVSQKCFEGVLGKADQNQGQASNAVRMLASSMLVGLLSAPSLAMFNAGTMGKTPKEALDLSLKALKSLTAKQTGAIVARETSFLFSLRISEPATYWMKRLLGENKVVEYGAPFVTGAVGSLVGHPADTALTLWQKGMKVENARQLLRGAPVKALTLGGFSVCYKVANDHLQALAKSL